MTGDPLPDLVVRYADHADGVCDLHVPTTPNGTTVLLLHGGFWKTAYDRSHTRPMARALAEAGLLVATPEYRRVGPAGRGGWPATGDDVHTVATALPDLLAGNGLPADTPLRTVGHSAGGHLALWLASTDVPIERTVALAPVCDLSEAVRRRLGGDATRALLGDADPAAADPMVLLDERPAGGVTVLHGVDDEDVPVELSRGFAARHPWVDLRELPCGHFEVIDPGSAVWPDVAAAVTTR